MPKRILTGTVISDKMDKTIVVLVERFKNVPKYHKKIKINKKYQVHDPENLAKIGDQVQLEESRPISKNKHWLIKKQKANSKKQKSPNN